MIAFTLIIQAANFFSLQVWLFQYVKVNMKIPYEISKTEFYYFMYK